MKPAYRLKILDKETDRKNENAGAAWINKDGSISIQVSPAVVINGNDINHVITLFPID